MFQKYSSHIYYPTIQEVFMLALKRFFLFLLVILPIVATAQDGKIRGRVIDKSTSEPLIGANVQIAGSSLGAATDVSGDYVILSVPPGVITLKVSYIGYAGTTISNVRVNANVTTTQNCELTSGDIQVKTVEVVAERPIIQRNTTNTLRLTTSEDIKNLPIRGATDILALNAGVVKQNGNLYVRGGRLGEVAFYVDGSSVTNPFFAGSGREGVSVIQEAIEEIQLQSGGYTAEFGGANSGLARTTMRTGGEQYRFSADIQSDDFAKPGNKFLGTSSFGYRNAVATVGGPIPIVDNLNFYVAGQHNFNRQSNVLYLQPFTFDKLSTDTYYARGAGKPLPSAVTFKENSLDKNWEENNSLQGTLSYKYDQFKFRVSSSYSRAANREGFGWVNSPTNNSLTNYFWQKDRRKEVNTFFTNLRMTHLLNKTTFYEVNLGIYNRSSRTFDNDFGDSWEKYVDSASAVGVNKSVLIVQGDTSAWVSKRVGPREYSTINSFKFTHPYSPVNTYDKNNQQSLNGSIDFTSQLNSQFELKAGGRIEMWTMRSFNIGDLSTLMDFRDKNEATTYSAAAIAADPSLKRARDVNYDRKGGIVRYGYDAFGKEIASGLEGARTPVLASAYVQSKLEYRDLIVNIGLRYEYMDQKVPTIANFISPQWDNNLDYFANPDQQVTYTAPENLFLPRVSFSFPISDKTVFYAMYGKYAQLPSLERLYSGLTDLAARISPISRVGYTLQNNPIGAGMFVRPERTTQYEMGIRQTLNENFALTVSGFYKDKRDEIQIKRVFNTSGVPIFAAYRNEDFSTIKGLELTFELRRTNRIAAKVNYTLSDARGTASTPSSSRAAASDDATNRFPLSVSPFEFNQTHRGTIFLDYRYAQGDGGPWLEGFGANVLMSFNSGHNYTKILEPQNLGQASVWNVGVRPLIDPRTRNPVEPINSSSTPWTFNIDLNVSKVFYLSGFSVEVYANILNLINTKQVINLFQNTGTPTDDGWLRSPLSAQYTAIPGYTSFYQQVNIDNRWAYIGATGYDVYGTPRQVRFGVKAEF